MNRSKLSMFDKLRKHMSKAIRRARSVWLSSEASRDQETLTAKELQKKFPKRKQAQVVRKAKRKEATSGVGKSKRTTPGAVTAHSAPAYAHREGARWIKSSSKKIRGERTVMAHQGGIKK